MAEITNEMTNNAAEVNNPVDIPKVNFEQRIMNENPMMGTVITTVVASVATVVVMAVAKTVGTFAKKGATKLQDRWNARKAKKAKVVEGSATTVENAA